MNARFNSSILTVGLIGIPKIMAFRTRSRDDLDLYSH